MQYKRNTILTENDYALATKRDIDIFNAAENTPEDDELGLLLLMIKNYEDKNVVIPDVSAIDVIKLQMEEKAIIPKDLEVILG